MQPSNSWNDTYQVTYQVRPHVHCTTILNNMKRKTNQYNNLLL